MRFRTDDAHAHAANNESTNGKAAKSKERVLVAAQAVTAPMVASGGDSIRPSGLDLEGSHLAHEVPEYLRGRTRDGWLGPVAILGLVCILCLLVWQSHWFLEFGARNVHGSIQENATKDPEQQRAQHQRPKKTNQPTTAIARQSPRRMRNKTPAVVAPLIDEPATTNPKSESTAKPAVADNSSLDKPDKVQPVLPSVAQWLPVDAGAMKAVALVKTGGLPLHRLQPSESILSGCQLFVPSANRPKLEIIGGPHWQVCGTTHAMFLCQTQAPRPSRRIDLRLGRAVLTAIRAGDAISLLTPAGNVRITLGQAASAAIEMSYVPQAHGPINNRAAYVPTLSIVALEGEPAIDIGKESIKLTVGNKVGIQSNKPIKPEPAEAPVWIDSSFDRPVDLEAAKDLNKQLSSDAVVGDVLQSLATNGGRPETRAIAAQTLAC